MTDPTPDLLRLADDDLPRLWGEVMEEMRARGIVSSANNPIADIAERVTMDHFGGELAPRNTRGYDLKVGRKRIQVKGIRLVSARRTNLTPIRSKEFESVVVVVFDPVLRVTEILEISRRAAAGCWRESKHVNGYVLTLPRVPRPSEDASDPGQSEVATLNQIEGATTIYPRER